MLQKIKNNKKNYLYDFTDIKNKKIIEFNGDIYHANPKIYNNANYIHPYDQNITIEYIWEKDQIKNKIAKDNGFEILYIWESDYKNDKELCINQCKQFLNL